MMLIDEISNKVAKELNLNKIDVEYVNRLQWKLLMETMQQGEFKPVQIFYLGKFFKNKKYGPDGRKITKKQRMGITNGTKTNKGNI